MKPQNTDEMVFRLPKYRVCLSDFIQGCEFWTFVWNPFKRMSQISHKQGQQSRVVTRDLMPD